MFILGCHRSGTSMLTGVARQLIHELSGTSIAEQELVGGNAENPAGFFESQLLVQTSNHLLELVNASWDRPFLAKPVWKNPQLLESLVPLREQFSHYWQEPWIDKDPRLCLLWDAYSHILLKRPTGILVIRNPLKVAASLELRNGFSANKSALIWWLYNYHIITTAGQDRLLILCDDSLVRADKNCLAKLASFFKQHLFAEADITVDHMAHKLESLLEERFQPNFRRATPAQPTPGTLLDHAFQQWQRWQASDCSDIVWKAGFECLPSQVLEHYDEELGQGSHAASPPLSEAFAGRCRTIQSDPELISELQSKLADSLSQYQTCQQELVDVRIRLETQCQELSCHLQEIRGSSSWQLTRPLRWMGDKIRATRRLGP